METKNKYITTSPRLADKHYQECVTNRGLNPEWIEVNCRSMTIKEASERLGYEAKSAGIWLEGVNGFGQFRPDKAWKGEADKKAPKYRTATGEEYDAILPRHPDNPDYWKDLEALKKMCWSINGHPCLGITEGLFKAIAGCSNDIPCMALAGVEQGLTSAKNDPQGKRYLVETLEKLAKAKFGFIILFDADAATNHNVVQAQRKLAAQLSKFKVPVFIGTGLWNVEQGKGMDDYIQANGADAFIENVMRKVVNIDAWEKQFSTAEDDPKKNKIPPADRIAGEIAEEYRDKLAYNNEAGCWMRYEVDYRGVWSSQTDEYIESIVFNILRGKGIVDFNSYSYVTNIVKVMRCILIVHRWGEKSPKDMLPFINGVLDIATGKLLPHSPGYRFTWQLPREHKPQANDWTTINNFLDHLAAGNEAIKNLLLCYCNAVIKGRHDLQKFLHLIGLGGTGKGTFARLIVSLIGKQNVHSTTLEDWLGNRFEGANAYRKRLVLFPDEDKQTGKLGKFLSLTGEDDIRAEEKGRKAFLYRFDGMVLVLSNEPIFTGGSANRVKRRVLTVPCNNPVTKVQLDLEAQFEPELSAFTNYILSIPDEQVTNTLLGRAIPECTFEFWENRMRVDSIAAWLNNCVIHDPAAEIAIGSNRHEGTDGREVVTLFGSYNRYCQNTGNIAKAHNNFPPDLLELCKSVLGWEVERKATKTGKFIRGLRLRRAVMDDQIPTYDYILLQKMTVGDGLGDELGDELKPLQNKAGDEGDGLFPTQAEIKKIVAPVSDDEKTNNLNGVDKKPSPSSPLLQDKDSRPSPSPSPSPSPTEETEFNYGDRVKLLSDCNKYTAGTEMFIHAVGNRFLRLCPIGYTPTDIHDGQMCSRLREQVELIPQTEAITQICEGQIYQHVDGRRFRVEKSYKTTRTCKGYFEREIEITKINWSELRSL